MGYQKIKDLISDIDEFHNEAELREILQEILFICNDNINKKEPSISNIREHLKTSREPMEAYYREWDGRWLKLVVTPDKNYSDERPYVIYAIKECNEQIERDTASIINSTAVTKI